MISIIYPNGLTYLLVNVIVLMLVLLLFALSMKSAAS